MDHVVARMKLDLFGFYGHGKPVAGHGTCPELEMLSPLKANHLVSCLPRLSLSCARNFATTSRRRDGPLKSVGVTPEEASDTLPSPAATANVPSASLNRYFSLPPLPPTEDWLAHFIFGTNQIRDRISIRHPVSAISVAHSFINSKKTFTGKPKVIVEAFPGVWHHKYLDTSLTPSLGPGALSRAFLTLPSSQLRRLIILEDHEPYLEYLRVRLCFFILSSLQLVSVY